MLTCKGIPSFVPEIPDSLQKLVTGSEIIQLPLGAGVSAVLGQGYKGRTKMLISATYMECFCLIPLYDDLFNY